MTTNRFTDIEGENDEDEREPLTFLHDPQISPSKPKPTRVYFYPLPNYSQDRRHDPRSRDNENSTMLPYANGYLERFESTAEVGFYFVELRAGREILGGDVHEVKPKGHALEKRQPGRQGETQAAPVADDRPTSAQSINATTEAIHAAKELLREVAPQSPALGAQVTREDVQAIIRDAVRDVVAQTQLAKVEQPPDQLAMLDRVLELQKKLAPPAPPAQKGDEFDRVISLFERVSELQSKITPARSVDDEESGLGKAAAFLDVLGKNAAHFAPLIAPMMPARLKAMLTGVDAADAMPQQEAEPQPTGAQAQHRRAALPQNEQEAFRLILEVVVSDLTRNKRAGRVADLIEEMCLRFPALAPTAKTIMEMDAASALALLSQHSGRSDLPTFGHALSYVQNLQNELRSNTDDEGDDDAQGNHPPDSEPSIVDMANEVRG